MRRYAARNAYFEEIDRLGKVPPVMDATENLLNAFEAGDDKRCHHFLQELADLLLASGYKARRRRRPASK